MNMNPTTSILERLTNVKQEAGGYSACCPAHEDKHASLSIKEGEDGRCLIHCHAGCTPEAILSAIGLKISDLYPPKQGSAINGKPTIDRVYKYLDATGKRTVFEVVRYKNPKGFKQRVPDGSGGYAWSMKSITRVLYQLPVVKKCIEQGIQLFVVEGEKDVHSLYDKLGLFATCNAGGAGKWQASYSKSLMGANVIILPDNDTPGRDHAQKAARALQGYAKSIRLLELPNIPDKGDVSDWIAAGGTREQLQELANSCPEWEPTPEPDTHAGDASGADPFELRLTDAGNARALVGKHGADIRYDHDAGKWLMWTGTHWQADKLCGISRLAEKTVRDTYGQLPDLGEKQAERMLRHIQTSLSKPKLDAMISLAAKQESVAVNSDMLDADNWLLNCRNGVIDLRNGKLKPHNRADLMMKLVPVDFDPTAKCPRWEQFMQEVFAGDADLIGYIQKAIGYTMTGDTSEQCFFMLYGNGSNGKSTLINVVREILSDYHVKTGTDTILEKQSGGISNDIARLRGARFVSAVEANPSHKLAEELVKELTGNDAITARFLYQEAFTFVPLFKLWLACNHKPSIDGQDNGIWRRIKLIPFTVQFNDSGAPAGPYKDSMLPDKLRMEYSGILRWMIDGCLMWQKRGLGRCSAVDAATNEYRSDMDVLAEFIDSTCVLSPTAQVQSSDLYAAYNMWCECNGIRHPYQQRTFTQRMKERGYSTQHKKSGSMWVGIELNAGNPAIDPIYIGEESQNSAQGDRSDTYDSKYEKSHSKAHIENSSEMPSLLSHLSPSTVESSEDWDSGKDWEDF